MTAKRPVKKVSDEELRQKWREADGDDGPYASLIHFD